MADTARNSIIVKRAWSMFKTQDERLDYIVEHTGTDRPGAEAMLDRMNATLEAKKARARGFVRLVGDVMHPLVYLGIVFHGLTALALLVFGTHLLVSDATANWLSGVACLLVGVLAAAWAADHVLRTRRELAKSA